VDLQTLPYRDAWTLQERAQDEVVNGGEERVFFVEHPPVITYGRRPEGARNLVAADTYLRQLGVEVDHSDRGGDITFHGPGQLVAYPIVRIADHRLSVGGYVHRLEDAVIDALRRFGIDGLKDPAAPGVWVRDGHDGHDGPDRHDRLAKICALGVRIRRGVSMHGIALNVTTDLRYFDLIVPCGLPGRAVTSLQKLLLDRCPTMADVKTVLAESLRTAFGQVAATGAHDSAT
jgi:lipoyl(octanoyl) transferase